MALIIWELLAFNEIICPSCGSSWYPSVSRPLSCPRCKSYTVSRNRQPWPEGYSKESFSGWDFANHDPEWKRQQDILDQERNTRKRAVYSGIAETTARFLVSLFRDSGNVERRIRWGATKEDSWENYQPVEGWKTIYQDHSIPGEYERSGSMRNSRFGKSCCLDEKSQPKWENMIEWMKEIIFLRLSRIERLLEESSVGMFWKRVRVLVG